MNSVFRSRVILLLIFSLGCFTDAYCQNPQIDSLNRLLKVKREVPVLCELARENIMLENWESALQLADEALVIASKEGDSLGIVMAHRARGVVFRRREQLDKALEEILPAFEIAKRHHYLAEMKYLLNSIAIIYSSKAQYDLALEYHFQSLVIREELGDQSEISIAMNNIGSIYSKLSNYSRALDYFNKSLKIKQDINDDYDLDKLLINIGLSEMYLGNFEKAASNLKEAFEMCGNQCSNEIIIGGEFGLGEVDFYLQRQEESFKHFTASYDLAKRSGNQRFQSENLIMLGKIAMKSGNLPEAEKLLNNAEDIANKAGYSQLMINACKELFNLYSLQKNSKKEILYLKKYVALSDSLISLDLVKNIATIQSRFDERENLKNIKILEENIVLKNEAIARQQLLNIVLGSAAVLLVTIGILIYRLYALRKKSNKQLDDKVRQRTQQMEERQLALQNVFHEQGAFMRKTREELKALTATIRGVNVLGNESFDLERALHLSVYTTTLTRLDALIDRIEKREVHQRINEVA